MGSAMSHPHHNFNLDIQQYCGSKLATEKTRFPSSRLCSKSNASEQRQSSTKWRPCPEGFTPTALQPGGHLRPSSPSAQAFLYKMFYFKLIQVPNSPEVQQDGLLLSLFCWACWCLACPFVIPPSHFEVLRSYRQLFAFFPSPLFPERKKIVPETWESAKKFLCLKGIFRLSYALQELLSNKPVPGDSQHKCTGMVCHPHACPRELAL